MQLLKIKITLFWPLLDFLSINSFFLFASSLDSDGLFLLLPSETTSISLSNIKLLSLLESSFVIEIVLDLSSINKYL